MTNETPEPAPEQARETPASSIYLGADGQYHDDTDANRENYPAAEDAPAADAELAADGGAGADGADDGAASTFDAPEQAPAADDAPSAKTRKA